MSVSLSFISILQLLIKPISKHIIIVLYIIIQLFRLNNNTIILCSYPSYYNNNCLQALCIYVFELDIVLFDFCVKLKKFNF